MKVRTYFPCEILKPFIGAYTIVETLQESTFKVLPDTGLVLPRRLVFSPSAHRLGCYVSFQPDAIALGENTKRGGKT